MENTDHLIYIDDLTGLYNRRYLQSHLPEELYVAKTHNYSTWLFMMDIDNFKIINDTYGHLCGDDLIKEIAAMIKESTKAEDKKIRYAGDEFTIILPHVELKDVISVAERILSKVKGHIFQDKRTGKEMNVTLSIGIAGFPQDTLDATELINLADKALYIAKEKGRDCFSLASEINPALFWKKDVLGRFPCSVFIGREAEMSHLEGLLQKTLRAEPGLALITGELGVGKSRLLIEFEKLVSSSGAALCFNARCEERFLAQSCYAIGQILYKYFSELNELPPEFFNGFTEVELSAVFNFMPILNNIPGAPLVKSKLSEDNKPLLVGTIKLLQNISRIKPICLFFDNFQYTDRETLEIILQFKDGGEGFPIFTIAAFSSADADSPEMALSALTQGIKSGRIQKLAEIMVLSNLSAVGSKEIIANIFSSVPLSGSFIELICGITKGNPLFLQELLKYLLEKEYIFHDKEKWTEKPVSAADLPTSMEDTIKKRIDELSAETKEMIAKAAAIGDDFQIDLLQQIDSQDRGYILDLIEAAKKIGLVYESGTGGKDEFSFVTGEIRKILFSAMGNNQIKHLHSRIGEIKEKLNPDKLSSIAGELYYNFKKAEDWVRAEQYAKVIKEGKSTFYDQTIKYAQSLLQEVEAQKEALPLSKKAWAMIPEIIRHIYIASINYVLYPPQSQMRVQPMEEIYKILLQVFSETELLIIAYIGDFLVVNNKKVGKESKFFFLEGFISLMKNSNIESISFEKGLEKEEVFKFIDCLNKLENKEEGWVSVLKESGVSHIEINEIHYDISRKKSKEKESLQEIMLMDYLLGKLPGNEKNPELIQSKSNNAEDINQALEKFSEQISKDTGKDKDTAKADLLAKSIQKIGNQVNKSANTDWSKYKEGLAGTILSMEPGLRVKVLTSQLENDEESKDNDKGPGEKKGIRTSQVSVDMIKELSMELPEDIIIEVLSTQYSQKDSDIGKMKKLAQRFLVDPQRKEKLTPILKEKLNKLGASTEEFDWMLGKEVLGNCSLDERIKKINSLTMNNLFKLLPMLQVNMVNKELLLAGRNEEVEIIIEKLFSLLIEEYPRSKSAAGDFRDLLAILIQYHQHKLVIGFIRKIISACQIKEELFSSFFFPLLNTQIDKIIEILLSGGQYDLTKELLQCYIKDTRVMGASLKNLEPVMSRLISELTRKIDDKLDWLMFADILVLFKDKVTKPLIEAALFEEGVQSGKYFEAYLRRVTIAKILKRLPKESVLNFLKEKFSDARFFIIKSLIELIQATDDEEIIGALEIPISHSDLSIRKKTIFVLSKLKGKISAVLLIKALEDADGDLRKFALDMLKSRGDEFAIQAVKEYFRNNKDFS